MVQGFQRPTVVSRTNRPRIRIAQIELLLRYTLTLKVLHIL